MSYYSIVATNTFTQDININISLDIYHQKIRRGHQCNTFEHYKGLLHILRYSFSSFAHDSNEPKNIFKVEV